MHAAPKQGARRGAPTDGRIWRACALPSTPDILKGRNSAHGARGGVVIADRAYVAERCRIEYEPLPRIQGPREVVDAFLEVVPLADLKQENFVVLCLNSRNEILRSVVASKGTVNSSIVHPREVFAPAIESRAAAVIAVHNHPSGDPTPSEEDVSITKRLAECGRMLGLELLDHVVVGTGRGLGCWTSLQERKLI